MESEITAGGRNYHGPRSVVRCPHWEHESWPGDHEVNYRAMLYCAASRVRILLFY